MRNIDRHITIQAGWIAGPAFGVAMMAAPDYLKLGPPLSGIIFWGGISLFLLTIIVVLVISIHEEAERKRVIGPVLVMALSALGFCGGAAWYFWPSTPIQAVENNAITQNKVPSLVDYWKSDFPSLLKLGEELTVNYGSGQSYKAIVLKFNIYQDFTSNTKFLGFYVPLSDDTYLLCEYLADHYKEHMDQLGNSILTSTTVPGDHSSIESKGLTFSGRVYIYHEQSLSLEDLGKLESYYKSKNLQVQFRSTGYATTRWLQDKAAAKL